MIFTDFFLKLRFAVMALLVVFCVNLCCCAIFMPDMLGYLPGFAVICLLFSILAMLLPKKLRFLAGLVGIAALVVPVFLYYPQTQYLPALLHSGIYSALLLLLLPIGSWHYQQEISNGKLLVGFAMLFACYIFAGIQYELSSIQNLIMVLVFVYGYLAVLSLNRCGWLLATGGNRNYSRVMRWKNWLLATAMFGLALIPACILSPGVLAEWLLTLLRKAMSGSSAYNPPATEPMTPPPQQDMEINAGARFAGLGQIMILMVIIAVILGFIAVMIVIVYNLLDKSHKRGKMRFYQDFSDEITSTRPMPDTATVVKRDLLDKVNRRPLFTRLMNPAQQIRYRYWQLSQKHPEWTAHSTARENLPDTVAGLYEQARYSEHPVTAADVAEFKKNTSKRTMDIHKGK